MKTTILAIAILIGVAVVMPHYDVLAASGTTEQIRGGVTAVGGSGEAKLETRFIDIVNVMLYIIGAIAVIMIIFGGIRYVTSGGDSSRVKAAKDTILYSVVGLVVAILAYAIVNFVIDAFV